MTKKMTKKQMNEIRDEINRWYNLMDDPSWDENTTAMWAMAEEIVRLRKKLETANNKVASLTADLFGYYGDDRYLHEPAGEVPKGKTRRL
jgi:hypothetical protein